MAAHVSPYSGNWYPADPAELSDLTSELFQSAGSRGAPVRPGGIGYVVPHAGLRYSGTVAAAVYRHLAEDQPRRVILLGFSHQGGPPGIFVPEVRAIRTPFGELQVDGEMVRELSANGAVQHMPESKLCDHSVEIQLPLLQRAVPSARFVPVYVSRPSTAAREKAAAALASMLDGGTVLLASSDLTHYGRAFGFQPFPVDSMTRDRLRDLDESSIEAAGSLSPELFLHTLRATGATVCGYEPVSLLLAALRLRQSQGPSEDEVFQETLDYQTSGELTGDFSHSVSYGALGYFPYRSFLVSEEDGRVLIDSARRTIERYQETGRREVVLPSRMQPAFLRNAGVFVTLHQGGELRGCVGRCSSIGRLGESVPELTLASALDDSRFRPLSTAETGLEVEISVLSPLKRIADRTEFRVNQHGAVLETGYRKGVLLPQVATEYGWNADQFLQALARKTGVSPAAYNDPETKLLVFRAQIIRERGSEGAA